MKSLKSFGFSLLGLAVAGAQGALLVNAAWLKHWLIFTFALVLFSVTVLFAAVTDILKTR